MKILFNKGSDYHEMVTDNMLVSGVLENPFF